jgi:hypothetical protein
MKKLTTPCFFILPLSVSPPMHASLLYLVLPGLHCLSTLLSLICPTLSACPLCLLKVPKREIFDRSDSRDFYTIKSS